MATYEERLLFPLHCSEPELEFKTSTGLVVARGYIRVVIGGRGPYIEFDNNQIIQTSVKLVPAEEDKFHYYYMEYRSIDNAYVKFYMQKRTVDYADYRPGYWYASPFELKTEKYPMLIKPLEKSVKPVRKEFDMFEDD